MVQWEQEYLKKEETYSSDSGTLYIDLPKNEQIGMLMIELSASRTSTVNLLGTILDLATKIEVLLNGSKIAFSAEPEIASYMAFLNRGRLPRHYISQRGTTYMRLPIYFGRYWRDPEYLLNTGNYKTAQLQIPYSLSTTYYTTGTTKLTCWYERPRTPLSPIGFIRQRTVKTESRSAAAGEFEHDLPVDFPVLDIGYRAYDIDQFHEKDITDVKLDINSGREVIFDGRIEDLMTLQAELFGIVRGYDHWMRPKSGDTVKTCMGYADKHLTQGMCYSAKEEIMNIASHWGSQMTLTIRDDAGTASTVAGDWMMRVDGLAPHDCLTLIHPNILEPYPLNEKDEAKIVFTQGAYAIAMDSFLREVVTGILS